MDEDEGIKKRLILKLALREKFREIKTFNNELMANGNNHIITEGGKKN